MRTAGRVAMALRALRVIISMTLIGTGLVVVTTTVTAGSMRMAVLKSRRMLRITMLLTLMATFLIRTLRSRLLTTHRPTRTAKSTVTELCLGKMCLRGIMLASQPAVMRATSWVDMKLMERPEPILTKIGMSQVSQ